MNKHTYNFLRHPVVVFASMGIGVVIGIHFPNFSKNIEGVGKLYLTILNMTVLPILISAIISSVGNFVQNPVLYKLTFYALKVTILCMFLVVTLSLLVGLIFKPGVFPDEQARALSHYIGKKSNVFEFELYGNSTSGKEEGFIETFAKMLIPTNILDAFVNNNALGLAFVSIILGISAGLLASSQDSEHKYKDTGSIIIEFFNSFFKIFQSIIGWTLTLIPGALICIISSQVAGHGFEIMGASIRLIMLFYILGAILILINSAIAGYFSRKGGLRVLKASLYPTMIGFTTKNSVAAIPTSIQSLSNNLKLDSSFSQLLVPLFVILCRYGNLAWFALVSIFAAQLYGITLGIVDIIVLIAGLVLSGIATAGASGFATLGIIAVPLMPLGIPVETIVLILYAIDPIVDPLRSALIVQTNFCTVSLVGSKQKRSNTHDTQVNFSKNIEIVTQETDSSFHS